MKKKTRILLIISLAAVLVLGLLGWYGVKQYNAQFVVINDVKIPKTQTSLDYSSQTVPDTALLLQFPQLQELNVTGTGLTAQEYEALKAALPGCRILWSVPFQGGFFPEETTSLTVEHLAEQDIDQLRYFPKLQTVDARSCRDFEALDALRAAYPQMTVFWQLDVGSQQLTEGAEALVLGDGTLEELSFALSRIPSLKTVDASGCHDYAGLQALKEQYPECHIFWQVRFAEQLLEQTISHLSITCNQIEELESVMAYLPELREITFCEEMVDLEKAYAFRMAHENLDVHYAFSLCGVPVTADDTVVDLTGILLEDAQQIESSLKYFKDLQKVIMLDCGLENDVMCPLSDRNPEVHFVWNMYINYYITVPTDITFFMPYQFGCSVTDEHIRLLKYCKDLVCVDLGHMPVSDLSFLYGTPHMKYLLVCDSYVRDITPVAGLQELIYLELFLTDVSDYSPLLTCTNLQDLNICYAQPKHVEDLKQMTWLNNLWMKGYWNEEGLATLKESLPNTRIVHYNPNDAGSTSDGWRQLKNYYDMRDLLGMPYFGQG